MTNTKLPTLLVFGYPLSYEHLGGLVWIKKVVDYVEKSNLFDIRKVSNHRMSKAYKFPYICDILAIWRGVCCGPDIAILDTYGEAAIWMWILLRLFRQGTKIVTVFHHYEPVSNRYKQCGAFRKKYYDLLDSVTKIMLKNSDKIITVSKASMCELRTVANIQNNKKIIITGCSNTNYQTVISEGKKDIDFLCIGRLEKFDGIESIWETIKKKSPTCKFVMAGRCSTKELALLRNIGIDHRGIVSEGVKTDLLRRSKVFLFPSLFEGFGIAVGEALSAKMIVITWKIPAFEERFPCQSNSNLRLIKIGDKELFVKNALEAVNDYDGLNTSKLSTENFGITQTWDNVGKNVVNALETTLT